MKIGEIEVYPGDRIRIIDLGSLITHPNSFKVGGIYSVLVIDESYIGLLDGQRQVNGWSFSRLKEPPRFEVVRGVTQLTQF
ncbi:MAG TPA: hypothetical protein PKY82_35385 [Pyrinomonadaceae bacterium]|nr:hypothetical protein [Pyrinomonadaceae bacterium]